MEEVTRAYHCRRYLNKAEYNVHHYCLCHGPNGSLRDEILLHWTRMNLGVEKHERIPRSRQI